jgi:hypothetical protein
MALALSSSPPNLSNLIVSDIAPTQASLSPSFIRYLDVMSHIENPATDVRTREHAGNILKSVEEVCRINLIMLETFGLRPPQNIGVRQFLLTNLILPSNADPSRKTVKFQVPVSLLAEAIPALGSFPYTRDEGRQWHGKTLAIKGLRSKYERSKTLPSSRNSRGDSYINEKNIPILQAFFPNMRLETTDTGHWGVLFDFVT